MLETTEKPTRIMKKTKHAGLYILKGARYRLRATVQCPRTGRILERVKTLPASVGREEALMVLAA